MAVKKKRQTMDDDDGYGDAWCDDDASLSLEDELFLEDNDYGESLLTHVS